MGEQIVLSISLLASNRKATIGKCLDSLRPIMEKVPSELIIVDTGCDQETQDILKQYTEQIIPFQWCDDFSKARNAGLKQAKGEWFLYIDDDEWFTDVTDIVNFFLLGEYKQYGVACYIQRNFSDREGNAYRDSWVSRMIRMTKETRFMSSIHEYLMPVEGECKLLKSPAHHYGYVFDSKEAKQKHAKRNIVLLLDMLKKERGRSRWWIQLAQEYMGIEEFYQLEELCREAIRHFEGTDSREVNKDRGTFYVGCIRVNLRRGFYKEAAEEYEKAIRDKRNTEACQAALHIDGAAAYIQTEQYEKAAGCCRSYLKLYKRLSKDEMALLDQGSFFVRDAFEKEDRNNAYAYLIVSELKQGMNQAFKKYFKSFGWEDDTLFLYSGLIPEIIDFLSEAEYDDFYVQAANILIKRKGVSEKTVEYLREKEEKLTDSAFLRLARIFSQVDSGHYYIIYLRILYEASCGETQNLTKDFEELFACLADFLCLPDKFWDIAKKGNVDLHTLFCQIKFDRWKEGVDSFAERSDTDEIEKRRKMMFELEAQEDVRDDYFKMKTQEALLANGKDCDCYNELHEALLDYVDSTLKFYGRFFNDNAFSGEMEMLPPACRLVVRMSSALLQEMDCDCKTVLEAYKDCLNIFPAMDGTIGKYAHLYKEHTKAELAEFVQLKGQVKEQVRQLIAKEAYKEAGQVLLQLKQMAAEDADISALEKELSQGENCNM